MLNWSKSWTDIVHEAHWRAAVTRRRYQVYYERANGWWVLRETQTRLETK